MRPHPHVKCYLTMFDVIRHAYVANLGIVRCVILLKMILDILMETRNLQPCMFATIGSLTAWGGRVVTATSESKIWGRGIACVGDIVAYPSGKECKIIEGIVLSSIFGSRQIAFVGSLLSNGDRIVGAGKGEDAV